MTRRILLGLTILLALLQAWDSRFAMFSDGISYLDIARNLTVNAYWSPLFSWMLAPIVRLTPLAWTTPAVHLLQAIFAVTGVLLADRLWRALSPETADDTGWLITRWMGAWWMVFALAPVSLVQPDVLCLCLLLWACICVVEKRPILLGIALALGYLAKAAMLPFAVVLLACWFVQERRRAVLATAVLLAGCLPWWIALHQHTGHWTIGESGALNYAWEVRGVTRWIHGQGGPNSTHQISHQPDAFTFAGPYAVTYPPWYEPSHWYKGLEKVSFSAPDQLRALKENGAPTLWHWFSAPGILALLVLGTRIRDWSGFWAEIRSRWMILVPCLATLAMYSVVFFETRYIAAQLLLLGLVPILAAYRRSGPPAVWLFPGAAAVAVLVSIGIPTFVAAKNLILKGTQTNPAAAVAAELRQRGLTPGTKVGVIGITLTTEWARQAQLQVVGEVPVTYGRDPGPERLIIFNVSQPEAFWKAPAQTRDHVLTGFAAAGAQYAVANMVPAGSDTSGWTRLSTPLDLFTGEVYLYIRALTPPADPPAKHASDTAAPVPAATPGSAAPKSPPNPA